MKTRSPLSRLPYVALVALTLAQGCSTAPNRAGHLHAIAAFERGNTHTIERGSNVIEVTQALGWPDKLGNDVWIYPRVFTHSEPGHDDCQTLVLVVLDGRVRELFGANEAGIALLDRELTEARRHGVIATAATNRAASTLFYRPRQP